MWVGVNQEGPQAAVAECCGGEKWTAVDKVVHAYNSSYL
jgi:hypothetical protein